MDCDHQFVLQSGIDQLRKSLIYRWGYSRCKIPQKRFPMSLIVGVAYRSADRQLLVPLSDY